ncbi:hypothetical protein BS50DRAFT_569641 [Corynespora cassiicola Philippines]|uniref:DNA repair and recombination protein RAD26 n=1 Tax=Corynespora cassiicola Philippines TaxID=1448308 RepID=A0A2T2P371_CORCC|nr:hypothetical protein BS50DRAFT_569641 [Corynespora cassiicola Philippines]
MLPESDDAAVATAVANPPTEATRAPARESTPTPVTDDAFAESPREDADIPSDADEETRLKFLTAGARDQDDLERDIGRQADQLLTEQADERDKKRIEKAEAEVRRNQAAIAKLRSRLAMPVVESQKVKIRGEIAAYQKKVEDLDKEQDSIQQRINDRHKVPGEETGEQENVNRPLPNESRRDFLIRTGKITPFSKLAYDQSENTTLADTLLDAEVNDIAEDDSKGPTSHRNLRKPGFESEEAASSPGDSASPATTSRGRKRGGGTPPLTSYRPTKRRRSTPPTEASDAAGAGGATESGDAYTTESMPDSDDIPDDDEYEEVPSRKGKAPSKKSKKQAKATNIAETAQEDLAGIDDGNEKVYQNRLRSWADKRFAAREKARRAIGEDLVDDTHTEECYQPHPTEPDHEFEGGFRIPGDIYPALFGYQKTGVEWLWQLYQQNVGGIVADEMGLGKTIQAISFIAGLHYSKILTKPVIIVCPATLLKQWVNEFHRWWPALRVSILHASGSGMLDTRREDRLERDMELRNYGEYDKTLTNAGKAAKKIIQKVKRDGHVLITSYTGLQSYSEFLNPMEWETAILDEGHKIRNPNTSITIHCKELRTSNRIILSGTPMQNNLVELWSLFDFVFPMRLGTLVNFRQQFEFPIKRGGYANASNLEFETARQCAETLKEAVGPYLLQRYKVDVAADLPQKKEQVLFCKLTRTQRRSYENFLGSEMMRSIANGNKNALFGIDYLRKICNHPDLTEHSILSIKEGYDYGAGHKSGKMQVVKELLSIWTKGGHKTLLFAQHRIMLDIMEKFIGNMPGINYRRMDGNTDIKKRQDLVDEFNNDPDIHVFLLTTKVGGLGVNLTGADRVIIYDPDWNPSTDIQARERSWRLGQKRAVEIYRLMSAGTIEEKIYHRQIFKQFLTNKVLKDPTQRQSFAMSDLHDLFSLGSDNVDGETETGNLFRGSEVDFKNQEVAEDVSDATIQDELANVKGIDHAEAFRTSVSNSNGGSPSASTPAATGSGNEDPSNARLMSTIFAKSGVHSVVEHESVIASTTGGGRKRKVQADAAFVQREAKKQATLAAMELKKSLEEARQVPAGVPTWTGEHGEAGRPAPRAPPSGRGGRGGQSSRGGRGGPSSNAILNNLSGRQGESYASDGSDHARNTTSYQVRPSLGGQRMMKMIRDFMLTHGGSVPTKMLVDQFDHYCRAVRGRSELFQEMLKNIATLKRGNTARSNRWVLKDEYKQDYNATRRH